MNCQEKNQERSSFPITGKLHLTFLWGICQLSVGSQCPSRNDIFLDGAFSGQQSAISQPCFSYLAEI